MNQINDALDLLEFAIEHMGGPQQVLSHPGSLIGIIDDMLPHNEPMRNLMKIALSSQMASRISMALKSDADAALILPEAKRLMREQYLLQAEAAEYIVDAFAYSFHLHDQRPQPLATGTSHAQPQQQQQPQQPKQPQTATADDYQGDQLLGMRMGLGVGKLPTAANDKRYAGQWSCNHPDGVGIAMLDNGVMYCGQWHNGYMHGHGSLYYPNGEVVTTVFVKNEPQCACGIKRFIPSNNNQFVGSRWEDMANAPTVNI